MSNSTHIAPFTGKVHRTERLHPDQLAKLQQSAESQEKTIARWFWRNPYKVIGTSWLHRELFPQEPMQEDWPITSTRRALNTLKGEDYLIVKQLAERCKSTRGGVEDLYRLLLKEEYQEILQAREDAGQQSELFNLPVKNRFTGEPK